MITKEKLDELVKRLRESAHADELTQHAYGDAMWKNQAADALERLAAHAFAAPHLVPQWQEIIAAPKDGTRVLLWNWSGEPVVGYWGSLNLRQRIAGRYVDLEGWRDDSSGLPDVTHWQPLPTPPPEKSND